MYAAALLVFATLVAANTYDVTFANFASHEANLRSAYYDLSAWGLHGGQLPKVYKVNSNRTFDYMPDESYTEFKNILEGKSNLMAADPADAAKVARTLSSAEQGSKFPRGEKRCEGMIFRLRGTCDTTFYNACIDPSLCYYGNCAWYYIIVYYNANSFITLWESSDCNGHHGSFNPVCSVQEDQVCIFNFLPRSFGTKTDCHRQYSSDGCSSTSP